MVQLPVRPSAEDDRPKRGAMPTAALTPEQNSPDTPRTTHLPPSKASKPQKQRVLACVLCQQRKVKCDRKFPCSNCVRYNAQCVPSTETRRRRRRFPERELLDRLRKYEDLLRQNKVKFEPLHGALAAAEKGSPAGSSETDDEEPEARESVASTPAPSESTYEAKNIWHAMSHGFRDTNNSSEVVNDGALENVVKHAWDQLFDVDDHILNGTQNVAVDLSTLHPEPVHIFRLWQIYIDNVDPLLKVTHIPSLQGRIIEAASDTKNISSTMDALLFGIYGLAAMTLSPEDCRNMFGMSSEDLLTKFQFGCQQALLNCGFLRINDRDCLTAMYLYLISLHARTHPQCLSCLLGAAMRIAQRMGLPNESTLAQCTGFEAEMRRRLWWSLMLFDTRIGEQAGYKPTMLAPTWDCQVPLNVNDAELRVEMKQVPTAQDKPTEALFAIVRAELAEFMRNAPFHLDFTNPVLKPLAKELPAGGDLDVLEQTIQNKYLQFCDPDNRVHFMTIWTTRGTLARCRLMEHYSRLSEPGTSQTEAQRDAAMSQACTMLECDTAVMTSPLTKGYRWFLGFHFPFPAYLHIVHDLRRKPLSRQADRAWQAMSDNYEARFGPVHDVENPVSRMFHALVLQAWELFEMEGKERDESATPPKIVSDIRQKLAEAAEKASRAGTEQPSGSAESGGNDFLMPMSIDFGDGSPVLGGVAGPGGWLGPDPRLFPGSMPGSVGLNQFQWPGMGWGLGGWRGF